MQTEMRQRGDLVQYWFDTGAMGAAILYGMVIAAGPSAYRVRWESNNTNRIRQGDTTVKLAEDQDGARKAMEQRA